MKMSEEELEKYADWLFTECNEPISEVMWLISELPENIQNDIRDNVLKFIK
jgi:hypothetical protein